MLRFHGKLCSDIDAVLDNTDGGEAGANDTVRRRMLEEQQQMHEVELRSEMARTEAPTTLQSSKSRPRENREHAGGRRIASEPDGSSTEARRRVDRRHREVQNARQVQRTHSGSSSSSSPTRSERGATSPRRVSSGALFYANVVAKVRSDRRS